MKRTMFTVSCLFISVHVYHVMSLPVNTQTDPDCKDVAHSCNLIPHSDLCVDGNTQFAWDFCRRTCQYCNKLVCEHNETKYLEGETWKDGCRTVCMCDDPMNNIFKCRPPCLEFQNLPPGCHLEEVSGLCCEQPRCSGDIKIHISAQYAKEYPGYNYTAMIEAHTIITG